MKPSEDQIHLFVEQPAAAAQAVPVLPGISRIIPGGASLLRINGEAGSIALDACIAEPIVNPSGQPRLLLINSATSRLRVNGQVAPLVAVLKEKDFVQLPEGGALHVTILIRPRIGPPPPELLGRECPVCRVEFTAATKCYECSCGLAFHFEDSAEGLQCVQTRTECSCGRPIVLTERFSYQPELDHA